MDFKKLLDKLTHLSGKQTLNESAKPDFLDIDKDGDKKEPMKKAVADKKKQKVAEGSTDGMVRFVLDSERAYQAVMDRFGNLIDWDENEYMMVPERVWPRLEQVAFDADGIGAEMVDDNTTQNNKLGETSDYSRRCAREEDIISGKKPPRKNKPAQTSDYAKKREQQKKQDMAESKLAECGGMSYDQDSGMSINSSIDTRTGSKTVSVTASGQSADELMQILKLSGVGGAVDTEQDQPSTGSVKVIAMPFGSVGGSYTDGYEQSVDETYANEPSEQVQPMDMQLRQGTDLNKEKTMHKHSYRQGDNPMAMAEAKELAKLESELMEELDSIKVKKDVAEGNVGYNKHSFTGKIKRGIEADNKGWGTSSDVMRSANAGDEEGARKARRNSNRYYNLTRGDNKTPSGFPKSTIDEQQVEEGDTGAKPGWMLKQDPALGKKVKQQTDKAKQEKQTMQKYAGKKDVAEGVAEGDKNPHTSALGHALWRDLSKQKKLSPQQVQRNKERWAQRQAEKNKKQGVAEGMSRDEYNQIQYAIDNFKDEYGEDPTGPDIFNIADSIGVEPDAVINVLYGRVVPDQGVAEGFDDEDEVEDEEDEGRGWQFNRDEIGSLYATGETDAYNKEAPDPRYGRNERSMVSVSDDASVEEYMAGYEDAEFNF